VPHRAATCTWATKPVIALIGPRRGIAVGTRNATSNRVSEVRESTDSAWALVAAAIAAVLAVLGLMQLAMLQVTAFGAIAVGFALLAHGATLATRWTRGTHLKGRDRTDVFGISVEVVGGFVVIILGVIAASEIRPLAVLPIASIALGLAALLGGPTEPVMTDAGPRWRVTRDALRASGGLMAIAGLGAIALGALALLGGPTLTLTLIAILCVALALIAAGTGLVARITHRLA
jgi:hypothetical protein